MIGVDDAWSDLDLWWLVDAELLAALDRASPTRFYELELDGKAGHLCAHEREGFAEQVRLCHMDTIYQLRSAKVLTDEGETGAELVALARRPMREEVRNALFFWHYVEMRSEHRSCDTPIERRDSVAVLLGLGKTLAHALRSAIVLDGEPYPWDKWLYKSAKSTATGAAVAASADEVLNLLARDALRTPGPEKAHPIGIQLRAIRQTLIDAARAQSIDQPWLTEWYLHMDEARAAYEAVRWY